jgi:hypothetical protein
VIYLNWPTLLVQNSKSLAVIIKLTITINSYYYLQQFYIFIFFGQGNSFIFYSGQNQLMSVLITNWNTFYKLEYFFSKVFRYILAKCNISEQFSKVFWYILTRHKKSEQIFWQGAKNRKFFPKCSSKFNKPEKILPEQCYWEGYSLIGKVTKWQSKKYKK